MLYLQGTYFSLTPYLITAGIGIVIIGLAVLLPETRGMPLDELPPAANKGKQAPSEDTAPA